MGFETMARPERSHSGDAGLAKEPVLGEPDLRLRLGSGDTGAQEA